ncbi:MAG TPA: DUF502 domain-containing protein [bacterium]|nr:DUF502 domain-containing protein [bacterium]
MKVLWTKMRNKMLAGLLIIGPLGLTVLVLRWMFNFFDSFLGPYLRQYVEWYVPGMGILMTFIVVYVIGLLTSNFLGRKTLQLMDKLLFRLPIVKNVYSTAKGIFQALSMQGKSNFKKVVFIQYPRQGLWTLAFVTGTATGRDGEEYHSMFVPSTPNPTTGYVIFIKKTEVVETQFAVEEGLKLLISGGMILPDNLSLGYLAEEE